MVPSQRIIDLNKLFDFSRINRRMIIDWTTIKSEEDAEYLLSKYYDFHDWYVAGFSYDPLARSEDLSLNLERFKTDIDTLTVILRDDCKNKNGRRPEVKLQFDGV